jgi:hypothetical protein
MFPLSRFEAQSEDDARYLCIEMGWEFICACEG